MRIDVIDLRAFYQQPMGRTVQRLLQDHIRNIWPDTHGLCVMGFGYASPFLEPFQGNCQRLLNIMPAAQGVTRWPTTAANLTALSEEGVLPIPDATVDRLLLVHSLENTEQVRTLLREAWRVLSGSGRLLVITPNRRGFWARVDRTPFGHGRPYSKPQLTQLLRETQFVPLEWREALYMPPFDLQFLLRAAGTWEKWGGRIWPRFPGVYAVEVSKQIYAQSGHKKRLQVLRPVALPAPAAAKNGARRSVED